MVNRYSPATPTASVDLVGALVPAALQAITRNWKAPVVLRSWTSSLVSLIGWVLTGTQRVLKRSARSTMYPVIGLPPSEDGGVQLTVMDLAPMLVIFGSPGADGTPGKIKWKC